MNATYEDGYMVFKTSHLGQFILVEEEYILGDVNQDGRIDFMDAIMVLKYDSEIIELNSEQIKAADVNRDGEVNFMDAIQILRYDAELIDSFE